MSKSSNQTKKTSEKTSLSHPGKQFSSKYQPSWKAKSEWRERRRQAQKIMDLILKFQSMTKKEIEEYIKEGEETMDVGSIIILKYVEDLIKSPKMRIDWLNRHVSYAPQKQELEHSWQMKMTTVVKKIWSKKESNSNEDE